MFPLVELKDEAVDWEGNAAADINRINHTDIELVAVVWLDGAVVTILSEAITDAWVEDSDILLGCISIPEWILGGESTCARSTRTARRIRT
mgnify:CR=1 FL=1